MARDRWATFDCYGTLVDWNAGIRAQLARVFGDERAGELLERYHEVEPQLQADGADVSFHVWPGGHDGRYWDAHFADYLRFYADACD